MFNFPSWRDCENFVKFGMEFSKSCLDIMVCSFVAKSHVVACDSSNQCFAAVCVESSQLGHRCCLQCKQHENGIVERQRHANDTFLPWVMLTACACCTASTVGCRNQYLVRNEPLRFGAVHTPTVAVTTQLIHVFAAKSAPLYSTVARTRQGTRHASSNNSRNDIDIPAMEPSRVTLQALVGPNH